MNIIPYRTAMALSRLLAGFAFGVIRFKRTRTLARIRGVFPGLPESEVKRIAFESLANVLGTAVEMMRAPRLSREWMDRYVKDGPRYCELLGRHVAEGRGVVIMVPHTGNWYMAAWAMAKYGIPLFAIAARQRNPKLDAWMNRQYGDIEVLDRENRSTLVKIQEYLLRGRSFAILPDLRVRRRDVEAAFLGGTANVSRAGAYFAVKAGAPIIVAAVRRENGRHVFEYLATLRSAVPTDAPVSVQKEEASRLTREAMKLLSDFILAHPDQWYWYNKRWILEPPEN